MVEKKETKKINPLSELLKIGIALSAEHNIDKLLNMIVEQSRRLTNADGGTLYIATDDFTALKFAIVQNASLNIYMGGSNRPIKWEPVRLYNEDGKPNYANVSSYSALSGEIVNIPDVYNARGFNFEGTKRFDAGTGYRSKSMLVVPLRNHENDIIGVLQLLNAIDEKKGKVVKFSKKSEEIASSLASQAAVALTNNRLIHDLANLFDSFIEAIATAIDEKSPYTGGHVKKVVWLVMTLAEKINQCKDGYYKDVFFTPDEMKELRISAWLHDIGKITTPEHIVDKATKLETIYDRIALLKTRFEILKRDYEIKLLKENVLTQCQKSLALTDKEHEDYYSSLKDDLDFLIKINQGSEFLDDSAIERLNAISKKRLILDETEIPLITEDELYNLSIKRGTINKEERMIIQNHATLTYRILSKLPFPKKLHRVSQFAATHHECLNGSGYPFGLKENELPLQSRIIALADIFEALTSKDRPYKKAKNLSESLKIMSLMAKNKSIDSQLFEFFIKEKIYLEYAKNELSLEQIDIEDFQI
ncbi:MAG TPA: HD domain-containing phosphohydrolase [Syntrophorhabdaceae bacterium]|nr:HD domain-containing phosphohydrolase [Syntrophorhabdaceae bacterium]